MILTCLKCARQHDFPDGYPAGAAVSCWECGALHLAEKANQVRLATPAELEGFSKMPAYKDQLRVMAWLKQAFSGRAGMIPADEWSRESRRAARELGIEVEAHRGMGAVGTVAVNRETGEVRAVDKPAGECLHCKVIDLIGARAIERKTRPSDDLLAVFRAACQMSVAFAKEDCDPAEHARATGDMVAALVLKAHDTMHRLEAEDMAPGRHH